MAGPRKRIGELLVAAGVIDPLDLQAALAHQRQWGGQLGATLIDRGFISEKTLVETLSEQLNLPVVQLSEAEADPRALPLVPARLCEHLRVFPVGLDGGPNDTQTLVLAMVDPTDLAAVDQVKFHSGHLVKPVLAADQDIGNAIRRWYHGRSPLDSKPPAEHPVSMDPFSDVSLVKKSTPGLETTPAPEDLVPEESLEEIAIEVDDKVFSVPPRQAEAAPEGGEEVDPVAEGWLVPAEEEAAPEAPANEWIEPAHAWTPPTKMEHTTSEWESPLASIPGNSIPTSRSPASIAVGEWAAGTGEEAAVVGETEWDEPDEQPISIAPPSRAQWAEAVQQDVEQSWDEPPPPVALADTELPTVRIALSAKSPVFVGAPSEEAEPSTIAAGNDEEELTPEPISASTAWATGKHLKDSAAEASESNEDAEEEASYSFAGPASDWALGQLDEELSVSSPEPEAWAATDLTAAPAPDETPEPTVHVALAVPEEKYEAPAEPEVPAASEELSEEEVPTARVALAVPEEPKEPERPAASEEESPAPHVALAVPEEPKEPEPLAESEEESPTARVALSVPGKKLDEPVEPETVVAEVPATSEVDELMALDSSDLASGLEEPPVEAPPAEEPQAEEAEPEPQTIFVASPVEAAPVETASEEEFPITTEEPLPKEPHAAQEEEAAPVAEETPRSIPVEISEPISVVTSEMAPVEVAAVEEASIETPVETAPVEISAPIETAPVETVAQEEVVAPAAETAWEEPASEPPVWEDEDDLMPPSEPTRIERNPLSFAPAPEPVEAEPTERTPPAQITFPPGQGLVVESPVMSQPSSQRGWSLLGIENPTAQDAIEVMGALVDLLFARGALTPEELNEALRNLRERS